MSGPLSAQGQVERAERALAGDTPVLHRGSRVGQGQLRISAGHRGQQGPAAEPGDRSADAAVDAVPEDGERRVLARDVEGVGVRIHVLVVTRRGEDDVDRYVLRQAQAAVFSLVAGEAIAEEAGWVGPQRLLDRGLREPWVRAHERPLVRSP